MNYYPFHVGDYIANTAHLDPLEDIAYRRLLDLYYMQEMPLPQDTAKLARLIRMRDSVDVVATILEEFFTETDDGWRHDRCDAELAFEFAKRKRLFELHHQTGYRQFREFVYERDGRACVYCGASNQGLHLDHVIPQSRGGKDDPENLVAACPTCNTSKGAKTLDEWGGC